MQLIKEMFRYDENRLDYIDIAKALGIFLVFTGHLVHVDIIKGLAYSFHMPMFFVIAGLNFKPSKTMSQFWKRVLKSFKTLFLPGLIIGLAVILCNFNYQGVLAEKITDTKSILLSMVYCSGWNTNIGGIDVFNIGAAWFFIVLFFARTIFDLISMTFKKVTTFAFSLAFSVVGFVMCRYLWLPLSLDVVLYVLIYICIGYLLQNFDLFKQPILYSFLVLALWIGMFYETYQYAHAYYYFDIAPRAYSNYPLSLLTAVFGSLFLIYLSYFISKVKFFRFLRTMGQHSMLLLIVHIFDLYIWKLWFVASSPFISVILRIIIDLLVFFILVALITLYRMKKKNKKDNLKNKIA